MTDTRRAAGEGQVYTRTRNGHTEYVARLPLDEWTMAAGKLRRRYWHKVVRAADDSPRAARDAHRLAERALEDALVDRETGGVTSPERMTVAAFLDAWYAHCRDVAKLEAGTLQGYPSEIRFWQQQVGGVRLQKLSRQHVQSAVNDAVAAGRKANTVRNHRAVLRAALNYAKDLELVEQNVAEHAKLPKADTMEIEPLTKAEVAQFIAAVADDTLLLFTILTGCRQSEVLGLRWPDLDLDACSVTVRRKLYRKLGAWHEGQPKSRTSRRVVSILPELAEALKAHRVRQVAERLLAGPMWQGSDLVFCDAFGQPLHGSTITRRLKRVLKAAGLPDKTFHQLRHSHATALLSLGVPLEVIRKRLGHSDRRTTDIYAHVVPELEREASAAIGALLQREAQ